MQLKLLRTASVVCRIGVVCCTAQAVGNCISCVQDLCVVQLKLFGTASVVCELDFCGICSVVDI